MSSWTWDAGSACGDETGVWHPSSIPPPKDKRVLGCHADLGYVIVCYWNGHAYTDGMFPMIEVTHWTRLPPRPAPSGLQFVREIHARGDA